MDNLASKTTSSLLINVVVYYCSGVPPWSRIAVTASLVNSIAQSLLPSHVSANLRKTAIPECVAAGSLFLVCKLPPEKLALDAILSTALKPHADMLGAWAGHTVRVLYIR